jgi:hypothetical protein
VKRSTITRALAVAAIVGVVAPACSDDSDELFPSPPGGTVPENFEPAPGGLRRLLARQYVGSIRVLLGEAAALAAAPPPDASLHGFESIAAAELSLPPTAVAAYEQSARAVAQAAVSDPATLSTLLPCSPTGPTDSACHRQFVTSFGRLAWRRQLDATEIDRLTAIAQAAATATTDFNAGVVYATSALLQSPNFLFMVEVGEQDPDNSRLRRLTQPELLTRMSFFLLDHTPDAATLDLAEQGPLDDQAIRNLARSMIERPEARGALGSFYEEILRVRDIEDVSKNPELFPNWSPDLAHAMKEETLRLLEDIIWTRDADVREMITADYTFVNQDLAALYGVAPPAGDEFVKVSLPAEQNRSGILSTGGFLSRFAHPDQTSPTRRGLFVRTTVLCEGVEPPPPGVSTTLPGPSSGKTLKEQLQDHMDKPECHGCHSVIDTIGFALENYDAVGAYRTMDNGYPVDPLAENVPGIGTFASAKQLGEILSEDPRVSMCVVRNLLRSSLGHMDTPGELPVIERVHEAFGSSGYRMKELLVELVASPAFQIVGQPK